MKYIILMKYGELILKGANKSTFENALLRQVKKRIKPFGEFEVYRAQSTVYAKPLNDDCDLDGAYDACKKIFGFAALSKAAEVEKDMDKIIEAVKEVAIQTLPGKKTFKVEARRSDKQFPLRSPEICDLCGGAILETVHGIKVNVRDPETVIRVEIRDFAAYVHPEQEKGAGGMPNGSNGKGLLLLSGGIDSPVAGYMMCKRGVTLEAMHFSAFPYTSERALAKVKELARILSEYQGQIVFHNVCVTEIQEELRDKCDEDYFTLLLRRFMMKIAEKVARRNKCRALITGESIGQVASQTMEALCVTDQTVDMPVFRPCIGMDKEDIVTISRKIDTYETSILPYEDCCTVFTPRHPRTKPELEKVLKQQELVDFDGLIERAMETYTKEFITFGEE